MNHNIERELRRLLSDVGSDLITAADRIQPRVRRASKRFRSKKFLKRSTWDSVDVHSPKINMNKSDIFLGASDVGDYITGQIIFKRNELGIETILKEFTFIATRSEWMSEVETSMLRPIQLREENGLLIDNTGISYLKYEINSSSIVVSAYGDKEFVTAWYTNLTNKYAEVKNVIEWIYSGDGASIEVPVRSDRVPVDEMYPFLAGETLGSYYDRFLQSSASILLLIGPPGTGKTTFIRGLLQHAEMSAMVTYDTSILAKDYIFANFIEGDRNVMIVEDADNFLGARSDGNDFMHKFLNVGDGLVTSKNKKMIFSTNLASIKDIDPALIRPGRCFDILAFRSLSQPEATILAKKLEVQLDGEKEEWSIADIFHKQKDAPKNLKFLKRKVGFY